VLKLIEPGAFHMGDEVGGHDADELPVHYVRITEPYWMGVFELTQEQWETVTGSNPSSFSGLADSPRRPVETVSWHDCQGYLGQINTLLTVASLGGATFRLPSEAEWEYAAKAGTHTNYSYGDTADGAYMWYGVNGGGETHEVGTRLPNPWGFYNMHGNVGELVTDWFDPGYYQVSPADDPLGPPLGTERVYRNGSCWNSAATCNSSARDKTDPSVQNGGLGVRVIFGEPLPGSLAWAKRAGGVNLDRPNGIAVLDDDSVIVTGNYIGTATFGPGEPLETTWPSAGADDIYLARHDADGTLLWAKRAGGTGADNGVDAAALPDGSVVACGLFAGSATFGQGEANETVLVSAGIYDIYVARYQADGTLVWAKRAGGSDYDSPMGVAALTDGSSVVVGFSQLSAVFGPGESNETTLTSAGSGDICIARYGADGTLIWAKRAGGTANDVCYGVAVSPDGSLFVAGSYYASAVFGPGELGETTLTSAGDRDIFIARYYPDGTLDWARSAGGAGENYACAVAACQDGSVAVTGHVKLAATFGAGEPGETILSSAGGADVFLACYEADGMLRWAKRAGGTAEDWGRGVATLDDGTVLVAGNFEASAVFGPGELLEATLTSAGDKDGFVASYSADGKLAWVKQVGGPSLAFANNVSILSDGSAIATGYFSGTGTFGLDEPNETDLTSAGDNDIFIARFHP